MKIVKFGGASLSLKDKALETALKIAANYAQSSEPCVIILSAFDKVTEKLLSVISLATAGDESFRQVLAAIKRQHTDDLTHLPHDEATHRKTVSIQMAQLESLLDGVFLTRDITAKTRDLVLSFGEMLSAQTFSTLLSSAVPCTLIDPRHIIRTNSNFGSAQVDEATSLGLIRAKLCENRFCTVLGGFVGANKNGETTTFGRGSSDYTAALVAAALQASEIEIWTPVSGFMTADPSCVKKALLIPQLEYNEAIELTYFGATVMHPMAVKLAARHNINISLKNIFAPTQSGTQITADLSQNHPVAGITSMRDVCLLRIQGVGNDLTSELAQRVFAALSNNDVEVLQISQGCSQHSLCIAIAEHQREIAKSALDEEFLQDIESNLIDSIEIEDQCAAVAIVGSNMRSVPGISGRFFQTLGRNGINVITIAQGSSERVISVVIRDKDEKKALNAVHDAFFLSELKTLNLFIVGTGSVGSKLIEQLATHQNSIREKQNVDLRLVGLANSRQAIFSEEGFELAQCQDQLKKIGKSSTVQQFIETMLNANLSNSVFIDCTASEMVAEQYQKILTASISVVTPNKRANAGSYQRYCNLLSAASKANVKYFYETNVGAGLPVISTLQDLIKSGDEIIKVEAVLSGTLSYIFNSFDGTTPFSEVVRQAKEKGYTEPDPRDDLSGADVARKLLILAREMGLALEEKDIAVESLVPKDCSAQSSVDEFFAALRSADNSYQTMLETARANNAALRYIAQIENGIAFVRLAQIDSSHPFYSLSGSDNIISFVTSRYFDRPLVVKGPGAGTDVTAAGVMADILRIASFLS